MNTKLSRTILSAALLAGAFALAGCGGGDDTPSEDPGGMTDAEKLADETARADAAEEALAAKEQEEADAKAAADIAAMKATAKKLYDGISAHNGDISAAAEDDRIAGYNSVGGVTVSAGGTNPTLAMLSEDKSAMVAALHDWEGKRYVDAPGGDVYEAVVYSNVEEPTPGKKFNVEYTLLTDDNAGTIAVNTTSVDRPPARVAGSNFDQSSGFKIYELPDPNQASATKVIVSGSYHGVSGTYTCTPGDAKCASYVDGSGFQLGTVADGAFTDGGGSWHFKPSNPEAKVMSVEDPDYASYGWWIKKSADDTAYTASAFTTNRDEPDVDIVNTLQGTATYSGGAAGKYALYSSTGGTNDAGHFTADAVLEADFGDDTAFGTIKGTVDGFMGADGKSRNWSVELKEANIATNGSISRDAAGDTVWMINGEKADASGEWAGSLKDTDTGDGVPKVVTGTFDSTYGLAGKMVGAFGATK